MVICTQKNDHTTTVDSHKSPRNCHKTNLKTYALINTEEKLLPDTTLVLSAVGVFVWNKSNYFIEILYTTVTSTSTI
jgi:hypothetical protein